MKTIQVIILFLLSQGWVHVKSEGRACNYNIDSLTVLYINKLDAKVHLTQNQKKQIKVVANTYFTSLVDAHKSDLSQAIIIRENGYSMFKPAIDNLLSDQQKRAIEEQKKKQDNSITVNQQSQK